MVAMLGKARIGAGSRQGKQATTIRSASKVASVARNPRDNNALRSENSMKVTPSVVASWSLHEHAEAGAPGALFANTIVVVRTPGAVSSNSAIGSVNAHSIPKSTIRFGSCLPGSAAAMVSSIIESAPSVSRSAGDTLAT